jgi:hypothetical protein
MTPETEKAVRFALSTKPEGRVCNPHAPAGAFVTNSPAGYVTLEQLREIEWAPPSPYGRCPACSDGYGLHAPDCWLDAAIKKAEATCTPRA